MPPSSSDVAPAPGGGTVFRTGSAYDGYDRLDEQVRQLAAEIPGGRVCEIGAGPNPMLSAEDLERYGLEYVCLDVSQEELDKASGAYQKVCADVVRPVGELPGDFDLVLTKNVGEHVDDPATFHRNVLGMLRPGGQAVHLFSTLYEPIFVLNRLLPESLAERLLLVFEPQREPEGRNAKFPAYYRWCRGPMRRQLRRFEQLGYEIVEYDAYFGHTYFRHVKPLHALIQRMAAFMARRRLYAMCSYATVILRRPAAR